MKYLAFDIETAKVIPDNATDWKQCRPLGITCAATLASDEPEPYLFYSMENGHYAPRMTSKDAMDIVDYLSYMVGEGYTIITWNGLSFDFDILAEESGMHEECVELALGHIDMMYHIFCIRGHYLSLDKAARGLGLAGKIEGMTGAKAPQLWAQGQQEKVLEYVAQDVRTTLQVALEINRLGLLQWTSSSGRIDFIDIDRWLTVAEAQRLPCPDTSWLSNPVSRDKFTAWMQR